MKRLIGVLLLFSCFSFGADNKKIDKQCTSVSTTPLSFTNDVGGMTASFEEVITGSPASSSIVINGCKNGTSCTVLETYTGNTTSIRAPALDKIYDYFTVVPTWSGGTSPSVCVYYTVTIGRNGGAGSGGAVTSVAGKTGVVTLAEADTTLLVADLAARELLTNKDTDVTLAANSDTRYPSQKAIKAYVASQLGGGFYQTIQSAGTPATQRAATNFGAEFSVVDNVTKTDITVSAIAETKITGLVTDLSGKAATSHTHVEADVTSLVGDLASKLPLAGGTMVGAIIFAGGQTFPGTAATSHTHVAADILSGTLATARLGSGTASASTMLCGNQTWCTTLPTAMMPDLTGDLNGTSGSLTVNVIGLNGVLLSGLGTGILKNTATTGVPSIAVAGDFPTLNQNTSGNAATATAFASTPTQCSGGNFSTGNAANGNANCSTPAGSNPLTTVGDLYAYNGTTPIRIAGPATPDGAQYTLVSTPSGGAVQQYSWGLTGVPVNSQSGTPYVITYGDRAHLVVNTNSTTGTNDTFATPGSTNFGNNFVFVQCNMGTVAVTDTPTAATINGNATMKLQALVAGNNPACAFVYSDNTQYFAANILPTDTNGRLQANGFPAISGDATGTAGSLSVTVTKINGTSLAGLGTGILKNTTGTGTPSIATSGDFPTLNQSTTGNASTATAFDHTPTLGTTSQLCRGVDAAGACVTVSTLPTAMMPALTGDVTGTGGSLSVTVTKINGTSLGGLATGILKNTNTTGVPSIATVVDIDALYTGAGKCYLFKGTTPGTNDGCDVPVGSGSGTVNTGTATHFAYYASSTTAVSDVGADFVFDGTHTFTFGASAILDMTLAAVSIPGSAGAVPTADKKIAINTTNHTIVWGSNGTTMVGAVAATGTNTATTCTNQVVTAVSGIAIPTCTALTAGFLPAALSSQTSINGLGITASSGTLTIANLKTFTVSNTITLTATDGLSINLSNAVLASAPGAGVAHFPGSSQTATSGPVVGSDMTSGTVTATQLAAQYSKGTCTELWGGSGSSFALASGDDAISNNSCYNDSGVTRTITAVKCRSSIASNTTTVNPTFGSAGTGTTILSGALTCGSSSAYSSTGTVSNASWTTGAGINPVMGGTLTGTSIAMIVEYTY